MPYQDHLADSFPLLLIKPCSDNILMYGMQHIEDKYSTVIVTFVLRVIDDMTVYVFLNGDKLSDSEFSWDLSHSNGKLKYWSQLDNILTRNFTGVTYLSGVTTNTSRVERNTTKYQRHESGCRDTS